TGAAPKRQFRGARVIYHDGHGIAVVLESSAALEFERLVHVQEEATAPDHFEPTGAVCPERLGPDIQVAARGVEYDLVTAGAGRQRFIETGRIDHDHLVVPLRRQGTPRRQVRKRLWKVG